jgi:hypothetical protein
MCSVVREDITESAATTTTVNCSNQDTSKLTHTAARDKALQYNLVQYSSGVEVPMRSITHARARLLAS